MRVKMTPPWQHSAWPSANRWPFNFSLAIGSTFSFSVDTKSKEALPSKAKKKVSPSTLKRNMRRREEFLKKKFISSEAEKSEPDKEASPGATFQCDQCENVFRNEKGLKIHKGKAHKTVSPAEKVRMSSFDSSLEVSPIKESERIIPCHNCGGDMSPSHLCQEEPVGTFKCDLCEEQAMTSTHYSTCTRDLFYYSYPTQKIYYSTE